MKLELLASALMVLLPEIAVAQSDSVPEMKDQQLKEVTVTTRRAGTVKSRGVANADLINSLELLKAACCNLGESFTTNPSVDVNYSDAATGANKAPRIVGDIRADACGEYTSLPWRGVALFARVYPGGMDEGDTGVQGQLFSEERL